VIQWLHCLMLMDDTIIFATSREKMIEKLKILDEYCKDNGMRINETKTKFMAINGTPMDKVSFIMSDTIVKHCNSYVYLGVPFTADGRSDSSLKAHLNEKNKEVNKLLIFLAVNYDAPFLVKKRVLDAAFMSCILYGCESWLKVSLKPVETMYHSSVKALLGVRVTTPNHLCLIEAGFKPLSGMVKNRQKKFFEKMASRSDMHDDPFIHSMQITKDLNKPTWVYIESVVNGGGDFVSEEVECIKQSITNTADTATKFRTYLTLNPELGVHNLYTKQAPTIPDYLRITFFLYSLSSHRLRVEIGRWSKTPCNERLC
jgi:hypothetical protein